MAGALTITKGYRALRARKPVPSVRPPFRLAEQKGGRGLALTPLGSDFHRAREFFNPAHLLGLVFHSFSRGFWSGRPGQPAGKSSSGLARLHVQHGARLGLSVRPGAEDQGQIAVLLPGFLKL